MFRYGKTSLSFADAAALVSRCVHGAQSPWPEEVAGGQRKAYPAALQMKTQLDTGGENPEPGSSHVEVGRKPED